MKVDDRDVFDLTGPNHLCNKSLCSDNKRALIGALVQAVYVSEVDRHQRRLGPCALAPKWWAELGYELVRFLREDEESEPIVGAIYRRLAGREAFSEADRNELPTVVVAFRGTMLRHEEPLRYDMTANLNVFLNNLHATRRFFTALETIRSSVNEVGLENITIAGHSLGASIALLAGQTLAYEGIFVDTHLFSPPFPSPPIERIKNRKVKLALNLTGVACATGLSHLLLDKGKMETSFRQFFSLRAWCPHLYVNPLDPICSSYISYFNTHEFMQRIGASSFAHVTAPVSLRGTLQQFFLNDCKPFHLVPCAHLHVVNKRCAKLVRAHGLHQWWWPDIEVDYQKMSVIAGDMMSA